MTLSLRRCHAVLWALSAAAFVPVAGCRQVLDIPEPVACGSDDACNTADDPCLVGECIDGLCAYSLKAAGSVIDEGDEDDCKRNVCDDAGEVVVEVVADDAPADPTAGDCVAPTCDDDGEIVDGPADDAPEDETAGDCQQPACEAGELILAPADDPPGDEDAGDCNVPACDGGAVVLAPSDDDQPVDETAGDCLSPGCQDGQVVDLDNPKDAPATDIDGDCLAPTCDAGGMLTPDDDDVPTSGCGSCSMGAVVPWADTGLACYTGAAGTQNVGNCVGGTWTCVDNVQTCLGEQTPENEACGPGLSGFDEDCDTQVDEEGPGCNCVLGQTQVCYTGPGGTQNVGICDDGLSTCAATMMGNQYGPCAGEVLPQACDSCLVSGDQDCSGSSTSCLGSHVWSKVLGGTSFEYNGDALELPDGSVLALSSFSSSITANNTVTSDGGDDVLLVRYDADGNAINAKDFGGTAGDYSGSLLLLDDGYAITGRLGDGSSETFGSGAALSGVGGDGFIAKFNNNHTIVWKKLVGGTMADTISGIVRMPDNGVAIAGQFQGTINLGGSNLVSSGFDDIFVARFDALGNHVWSKKFGTNMQNNVYDLAVAANGDLVLVGDLGSNIDFGGGAIVAAGGVDGYVVRLDDDGNHLWTRAFQSSGNEYARRAVVLSDGSVWVAGTFDTAVNVNGVAGTEIAPTSTGTDILLVKYSATGAYLTARGINGTGTTSIRAMAVGFDDGVVVAGSYTGSLFFSMFAAPSAGSSDAFIFKIRPSDGVTQWSRKPGGTSSDQFMGVDVGSCGDVFAAANFNGTVNFGGGDLDSNGMQDIVVAKYLQ